MNDNSLCYFHPDEVVVGVCPLCLNEKLVVLASKRRRKGGRCRIPRGDPTAGSGYRDAKGSSFIEKKQQGQGQDGPAAAAPRRIFALGWFFFNRHWKSEAVTAYHDAVSSTEDSFISIRFEGNGLGSWEKNAASKVSFENCKASWNKGLSKSTKEKDAAGKVHRQLHGAKHSKETNGVAEQAPPPSLLRWRRRIGHLFQPISWRRSSKGKICHVDGIKVRNGWIRTLTRRRTKEAK